MNKIAASDVAEIGKVLGDPNRLSIYTQIARHKELYCREILEKQTITHATLSHHLKVLTDLGLVTSRKDGLNVFYRAVPERLQAYLKYLSGIGTGH